jgi:hypothetical protein
MLINVLVSPAILDPLRRSLSWLLSLRDADGKIVCPQHKVEHTGKTAGVIGLALALREHDPDADRAELLGVAVQQARRMVLNLVNEPDSPCYTFRPGRHDPFNCSNSVIDGGACADALAQLVREAGDELSPADREAFKAASLCHARTYLRYAVLDKGIPAQRAWGLVGLAGACSLERDVDLEKAAIEAVGVLEGVQLIDGAYPYHPKEWGAEHPGSADASAFYQSRVTGFLLEALRLLERDPRDPLFAPPLRRGLSFLRALQGPGGRKCGLVEAKPWYWGASYEVASNPFDVFTLSRGYSLFGGVELAVAAARAFRAWSAHVSPEGILASHKPGVGTGESYQCPVFWAGHAAWIARCIPELDRALAVADTQTPTNPEASLELQVTHFPAVNLVRLEDAAVVAWVRGERPPGNIHHGSPHGGLLQVVRKSDGRDLLERQRHAIPQEAEWSAKAGFFSLVRGLRSCGKELRFSLWLARADVRRGEPWRALRRPFEMLKQGVIAFGSGASSTAFDRESELHSFADGVSFSSRLARRDGSPGGGPKFSRSFRLAGDGLMVEEKLLDTRPMRGLVYRIPAAAEEIERDDRTLRYKLS